WGGRAAAANAGCSASSGRRRHSPLGLDRSDLGAVLVRAGLASAHDQTPVSVLAMNGLGNRGRESTQNAHRTGVRGWTFLLWWKTLSGSYFALTSARRP